MPRKWKPFNLTQSFLVIERLPTQASNMARGSLQRLSSIGTSYVGGVYHAWNNVDHTIGKIVVGQTIAWCSDRRGSRERPMMHGCW
ncbi:hypothetical protein DENSPDRAFT_12908 [Dentipellis sp. KUC8613]|nr:hypothetical protein DENSPDRAFT_12908 [Dentipellis sp. KUC8613]